MNDLSYGISTLAQLSFVLSQSRHLTDTQRDRRTDGRKEQPWKYRALHYMVSHGRNHANA